MTRSPFRDSAGGGLFGGMQVASVKRSTSLRMKNLGNVPPRLETLFSLALGKDWMGYGQRTYVANMVMYVPPIAGSAIRAWNADTATNITVIMNVEMTCSPITARRYQPGTSVAAG